MDEATAKVILELYVASDIAEKFGISKRTARDWRAVATARLEGVSDKKPTARERNDAQHWKSQFLGLEKAHARLETLHEQVAGLAATPLSPPDWLLPQASEPGEAVIGLLLTDVHCGEVVKSEEIVGLGAYDVPTCRRRLRRYFAAACEVGLRWGSDCQIKGAVLFLGGDLVSGDIHEELRLTNELTSTEQVVAVAEEITSGINHLADTYGHVYVVSVGGNHGRTTTKPMYKMYARTNYDTLVARIIKNEFRNYRSVSGDIVFDIPNSMDALVPVLGKTIFINHGNNLGTGGGMGFAGPGLPIIRGAKRVELQQFYAKRTFDFMLSGHFHTTLNHPQGLANGSVIGYSEYGNGLRCALEPPQQWLFLVHKKWGLRERMPIVLEG